MLGYVFGYGSLCADPPALRREGAPDVRPAWGVLQGFRRGWTTAMRNRDPVNDPKHAVDRRTGERPDVWVTYLAVEAGADADGRPAPGGVAIPVDAALLAEYDVREVNYDRVEVTGAFRPDAGEPWPGGDAPTVWAYVPSVEGAARHRRAQELGAGVVLGHYADLVEAAFAGRSPAAADAYRASTAPPDARVDHDLVVRRSKGAFGH